MSITEETRLESYLQRPVTRQKAILDKMELVGRPVTARELAFRMGFRDLNAVKPRLTEMKQEGKVRVSGKAYDGLTGRHVAMWEVNHE